MHIENPGIQDADRIRGPVEDWRDGDRSQTVLRTVMKNYARLRHLGELLADLDLTGIPCLLIDDEADQASLNTKAQKQQQSTTYRQLLEVRRRLPVHTLVQYTATPQAPLLISLIDALSPEFVSVLRPGKQYTGGRTFFLIDQLIRIIPDSELPIPGNELRGPPESLLEALRLFFIGVAAGYVRNGGQQPPAIDPCWRPSMGVLPHEQFKDWINEVRALWAQLLKADPGDPGRLELIKDMQPSYEDINRWTPDLPSFVDVMDVMASCA